jgi:hypothetical protein
MFIINVILLLINIIYICVIINGGFYIKYASKLSEHYCIIFWSYLFFVNIFIFLISLIYLINICKSNILNKNYILLLIPINIWGFINFTNISCIENDFIAFCFYYQICINIINCIYICIPFLNKYSAQDNKENEMPLL